MDLKTTSQHFPAFFPQTRSSSQPASGLPILHSLATADRTQSTVMSGAIACKRMMLHCSHYKQCQMIQSDLTPLLLHAQSSQLPTELPRSASPSGSILSIGPSTATKQIFRARRSGTWCSTSFPRLAATRILTRLQRPRLTWP